MSDSHYPKGIFHRKFHVPASPDVTRTIFLGEITSGISWSRLLRCHKDYSLVKITSGMSRSRQLRCHKNHFLVEITSEIS